MALAPNTTIRRRDCRVISVLRARTSSGMRPAVPAQATISARGSPNNGRDPAPGVHCAGGYELKSASFATFSRDFLQTAQEYLALPLPLIGPVRQYEICPGRMPVRRVLLTASLLFGMASVAGATPLY